MGARRGKIAVLLSGSLLAAVVVGALLSWKDLAKGFCLLRLRSSPDLALEWGDAPDDSPKKAALDEFFRTPRGREWLVGLFEQCFSEPLQPEKGLVSMLIGFNEAGWWVSWRYLRDSNRLATYDLESESYSDPAQRLLHRRLAHLAGTPAMGRDPGSFRMTFLTAGKLREIEAAWTTGAQSSLPPPALPLDLFPPRRPDADVYCLIQPWGDEAVAALADALNDPQARVGAALALAAMGKEARAAIPALRRALDARERRAGGGGQLLPFGGARMRSETAEVFRRAAEKALSQLGEPRTL